LLDYIAYVAIIILNRIFSIIPISAALWFGRRIGDAAFFFNKKRRLIAYANLKAAFAGEKGPAELRRITKGVYRNLLQTFVEILNLTKVDKKYVDTYVEVVNMKRIDDAAVSGRGTMLLTAHFGCWELSSLVSAIKGYPISVLAREQKMKRVNELLNRLRESKGCTVIRKGMSTKNLIRALYEKKMVGILSDQDAGKQGMFVDFFGRPTSSHSGPMEIAKRTDSVVLPNFIVRQKGPYHKLFLEKYIDFRDASSGDVKDNAQRFASLLESYVRKYPDQWLWLHKRWKSTPVKTVLVLNDGRVGHLNQSLAIALMIRQLRAERGYRPEDTAIVTVDVQYKSRLSRMLLTLCAASSTWRCHGCMRCMRSFLKRDSYDKLMSVYADFVVSCGSSASPVNVFMARENNARNFAVMKPSFLGAGKFSALFVPRHDGMPHRPNVVSTVIAPNLIDEKSLAECGKRLSAAMALPADGNYAGLLIGGDTPEFILTPEMIGKVTDELLRFCDAHGARLLVTTSRRTPPGVDRLLRERLGGDRRCALLVIANENNIDSAVGGILHLSKAVAVSGESISMISEAISAGKRTVVFELDKRRQGPVKHEQALRALALEGYISVAKPGELCGTMGDAWLGPVPVKKVNDKEKISEAIRRIL